MRRIVGLAVPVAAAGGTRLLQLFVLFVLVRTSAGDEQQTLVTGFALFSSFAIFTDSGASNYLLQLRPDWLSRQLHTRATGIHLALSVTGASAAMLVTLASHGSSGAPVVVVVLLALAIGQVAESSMRTARAPMLARGKDIGFALPDIVLIAAKAPFVLVALATGRAELIALSSIPSLAVAIVTFLVNRRHLNPDRPAPERLFVTIIEYGAAGSLSAFYSQAPLVLGTALLGVDVIAPLALALRVAQPLEILPATVSQQLIPRVRGLRWAPARVWTVFIGTGAVLAAILALAAVMIGDRFASSSFVVSVFLAVFLSVPVKFGNYALVAIAIGRGLIRQRLKATLVVGVFTVVSVLVVVVWAPVTMLAFVPLLSEILLLVTLGSLLRTSATHRETTA